MLFSNFKDDNGLHRSAANVYRPACGARQGKDTPGQHEVVTYVLGTVCNPCDKNGPRAHWSGRRDSNSRPSAPKADALPGCATPRRLVSGGFAGSCQPREWNKRAPSGHNGHESPEIVPQYFLFLFRIKSQTHHQKKRRRTRKHVTGKTPTKGTYSTLFVALPAFKHNCFLTAPPRIAWAVNDSDAGALTERVTRGRGHSPNRRPKG